MYVCTNCNDREESSSRLQFSGFHQAKYMYIVYTYYHSQEMLNQRLTNRHEEDR